jgi:hypothetical protein
MTASTISPDVRRSPDLRAALDRLRREATGYAVARLDTWQRQVKGLEQSVGATDRAVVGALTALMTGGHPIRAALAAAWAGADAKKKAQIVAVILLVLLLGPVVLLLFLLGLLVAAIVWRINSNG